MIAALWSNSNWDDDKNSRQNAIEALEEQFIDAISTIKAAGTARAEEDEIDTDNPFFAATERGLAKVEQKMGYTPSSEKPKAVDYMKGLDQEQ